MKNAPKIKHPLRRNGVSQLERLLSILVPTNFKVDAHTLQDIIAATHSYAQLLEYRNEDNQIDGDWACFWEIEPLTFLAIVSSIDTDGIVTEYQQMRSAFDHLPEEEQDEAAEASHALELIEYIKHQAKKVEHFYRLLPADLPLKREILSLIRRDNQMDTEQLAGALHILIGYHKEAYPRTLSEPEDLSHSHYAFFFSSQWEIEDAPDFYQIPFSTEYLARGFEKLDDLLKVFHQALVRIKKRADYWFGRNIGQPQVREPHVALFLAFLRLFDFAREDLNGLTREHLEYYYKRVLHMREAPAVSDEVHLLFELANNVDQYLVKGGTELLAGKDKNNRPLIFRTLEDWVVSKAKVKELKNTYLNLEGGKIQVNPDVTKKYCAQAKLPNEKATTWRAMGDDKELPYGEIGFAVASPQLILREGKRTVHLEVYAPFDDNEAYELLSQTGVLNLFLSGEKGWISVPFAEIGTEMSGFSVGVDNALFITVELLGDFPAIDTPAESLFDSPWPALKMALNNEHPKFSEAYHLIMATNLESLNLSVTVEDIRENLVVQSDQGIFNGVQKFFPFGPVPEEKDKFYIGSTEAFQKDLSSFTIQFDWVDPPLNYENHYSAYTSAGVPFIPKPAIHFSLLEDADLSQLSLQNPLFDGVVRSNQPLYGNVSGTIRDITGAPLIGANVLIQETNTGTVTDIDGSYSLEGGTLETSSTLVFSYIGYESIEVVLGNYSVIDVTLFKEEHLSQLPMVEADGSFKTVFPITVPGDFQRDIRTQNFSEYSPALNRGFVVLRLNADFLHKEYSKVLVLKSIEAANSNTSTVADLPNPPYTPATNGISLGYRSAQPIPIGPDNDGIDQFFHILPFGGYREVKLKREEPVSIPLLYPYPAHDQGSPDFAAGNLFIGLEALQPGGNLSLLFQMREGSEAEPDWQVPAIRWSYLAEGSQWIPFTAEQVLKDTTLGLTRTGLVQLVIPPTIVNETSLFEGELYWLRIAAVEDLSAEPPKSARALPKVVDIRAQVLEARFENRDNDLAHLAEPLPHGRVTKLLESRSEVKKIEQPFPSFNGQLPEKGNAFYRRASERLRHRDRAVAVWDYERILLQEFPKVYRAKCLSHTNLVSELAPGHVLVALIPGLKQRQDEFPVEPRFSRGDLQEIADYLRLRTNLFVACTKEDEMGNIKEQYLWVANPIYEPIRLKFDVRFRPGVDINFHQYVLDDDLKYFLAPWLKDRAADIRFNQSMHRSKIVQFIEERPYVDVVLNLEVEHCGLPLPPWQADIIPTTSRSILTTHVEEGKGPARTDHEIRTFTGGDPAPC